MRIAIIPARGGSKRIPGKNIKLFYDKPIISWSIKAAINSGVFDKVIVSTDDKKIAEIAIESGAEVPFTRPAEISDDFTGTNEVIKHAIQHFNNKGENIDYVCCIYATAPFIQSNDIKAGFDKFIENNAEYVFTVTSFPFPIQRAVRINTSGLVEPIWPENEKLRSQDLEEAFHDAGQFYWGSADSFLLDKNIFSSKSFPVLLPRYFVQDIDTLEDWKRAEMMFKVLLELGEITL